jgi:hypothetical protein
MRFALLAAVFAALPHLASAEESTIQEAVPPLITGYVKAARRSELIAYVLDHTAPEVLALEAAMSGKSLSDYRAAVLSGYAIASAQVDTISADADLAATVFGTTPMRPWALVPYNVTQRMVATNETTRSCRHLVVYADGGQWYIATMRDAKLSNQILQAFPDLAELQDMKPLTCKQAVS